MSLKPIVILSNPIVRIALQQAWVDSKPGLTGGQEEGGFIVKDESGALDVIRWPQGLQDTIGVPPHLDCKVNNLEIVASFHTHPNTGSDYLQEPSETDKRAVRDDADLKGPEYIGEFVLSNTIIYLITPAGQVREIDDRQAVFSE